jgi:hypothetical protein
MNSDYSTMDEIILNPKGNTYVGPLANKFSYGKLKIPKIFKLSEDEAFHVFEVMPDNSVVHRASQSTMRGARSYMNPDRVLVYKYDPDAS